MNSKLCNKIFFLKERRKKQDGILQIVFKIKTVMFHYTWRWTDGRMDLTFVDAVAEGTLEAAASVDELHVGTHVGLAPVAPDGARLTMVD